MRGLAWLNAMPVLIFQTLLLFIVDGS